jgi:hypothetical protein
LGLSKLVSTLVRQTVSAIMLLQAISAIRMIAGYLHEHHPELFGVNGRLTLHNEWGTDWQVTADGLVLEGPQHPPRVLEAITSVYARTWDPPTAAE